MTTSYLDTSAILKLTIDERESLSLIDYLAERQRSVSTSVIAEIEVLRLLQRIRSPREDQENAMRGFHLLNLDSDVRRVAKRLKPHHVRALDAIHIASALAIGERDLEFVTYDDRMASTARECGLTVVQPGR